jgi:hypothetical protein
MKSLGKYDINVTSLELALDRRVEMYEPEKKTKNRVLITASGMVSSRPLNSLGKVIVGLRVRNLIYNDLLTSLHRVVKPEDFLVDEDDDDEWDDRW